MATPSLSLLVTLPSHGRGGVEKKSLFPQSLAADNIDGESAEDIRRVGEGIDHTGGGSEEVEVRMVGS